jgi:CRISPR-associated protein Cas2
MRSTYLICYDIADAKRLRRVFKTMRNWGDHLQFSVFECQLSPSELTECRGQLAEIIHHELDQVLFIRLGLSSERGEREIEALGIPYQPFDNACVIV